MNLNFDKVADSMVIKEATPPFQFTSARKQDFISLSKEQKTEAFLNGRRAKPYKKLSPENVEPKQTLVLPKWLEPAFGKVPEIVNGEAGEADIDMIKRIQKYVQGMLNRIMELNKELKATRDTSTRGAYGTFSKKAHELLDKTTRAYPYGEVVADSKAIIEPVPGYPLKVVEDTPDISEAMKSPDSNAVAVIGSRETSPEGLERLKKVTELLNDAGVTLRSGGAAGADSVVTQYGKAREIYTPWSGFNGAHTGAIEDEIDASTLDNYGEATAIAKEHHPAWGRMSEGGRKLQARNTYQVLGKDLKSPSRFIVAWFDPRKPGGTGQAVRIAESKGIRVYNVYNDLEYEDLLAEITNPGSVHEYTPEHITALKKNEVFVFGSNLDGRHGNGAAKQAVADFGAKEGVGEGAAGQSYALPTKKTTKESLSLEEISKHLLVFLNYAANTHNIKYLVTKFGTERAGYSIQEIASLFKGLNIPLNVILPREFAGSAPQVAPSPAPEPEKGAHYETHAEYSARVNADLEAKKNAILDESEKQIAEQTLKPEQFKVFKTKVMKNRFSNFMKNLILEVEDLTPSEAALYFQATDLVARIKAFPGFEEEIYDGFVSYAAEIITDLIKVLQESEHLGMKMGMWPDEDFQRAIEMLVGKDFPYFEKMVNNPEFQKGSHFEQMAQFQKNYVDTPVTYDPETGVAKAGVPAIKGLLPGLHNIKKANTAMSRYYVQGKTSAEATDVNTSSDIFGLVTPKNSPHASPAIEFYNRTKRRFSNKTLEAHRKLLKNRLAHPSPMSYAKIIRQVEETLSINSNATIDVPLGIVEDRMIMTKAFILGELPEGSAGSDIPDFVNDMFLNNMDVLGKIETLQATGFEYAGEIGYMNTLQGNDVTNARGIAQLERLNAHRLAQFIYQQIAHVFIVPLSLLGTGFQINVINELKAYGIKTEYNSRLMWFKGPLDDTLNPGVIDWELSRSSSDLPEVFVTQMDDLASYLEASSAVKNPLNWADRTVRRYDGRVLSTYLVGQGVLEESEAALFAEQLQDNIGDYTPILADAATMLEIDPKVAATPLNSFTSAVISLAARGDQKALFFHRVKMENLYLNDVFRAAGDPKEIPSSVIYDRFKMFPGAVAGLVDNKNNIVKVIVSNNRKVGIKDIEVARKKGAFFTTNQVISKLIPQFNNGKLPVWAEFIDKVFNGPFKAGYLSSIAFGGRNTSDTMIYKNVAATKSDMKIFGYQLKAYQMKKNVDKIVVEMGNLSDEEVVAQKFAQLSEKSQVEFLVTRGYEGKITNLPDEAMMDMGKDLAEIVSLHKRVKAMTFQERVSQIAWGNPLTATMLKFSAIPERTGRTGLLLWALEEKGMGGAEAVDFVNKTHFNYSQKSQAMAWLGIFVPFAQFPLENFIFWSEAATENPWLLRMMIKLGTQSWQDEEQRRKRALSEYEVSQAMAGNMKIGNTLVKLNPSFFDAIALIPGLLKDPTQRLSPIITNIGKLMQGDFSGLEYPFEQNLKRISTIITKTVPQILGGDIERLPDLIPSGFRTDTDYKNTYTNAHSRYSNAGYNLYYAKGSTKMGIQYGMNRIGRSSTYVRKVYLGKGFYNSLYAKSGSSRIKLRMSAPTSKNLAMRIADQNYRFK